MTKLMLIHLIVLVIVAALAPMPKAPPPQQPQRVILPLYDALDLALAGKVRVVRYV